MAKLTAEEVAGLHRAAQAEHVATRASAVAAEQFGGVAVFKHLRDSASRHVALLCSALHSFDAKAPVLDLVPERRYATLIEALEAACERETGTAAIYEEILGHTTNAELKGILVPLWQSVSHLHLSAIADQLSIEVARGPKG